MQWLDAKNCEVFQEHQMVKGVKVKMSLKLQNQSIQEKTGLVPVHMLAAVLIEVQKL